MSAPKKLKAAHANGGGWQGAFAGGAADGAVRLPKGQPGELTLDEHQRHRSALFVAPKDAIDAAVAAGDDKRVGVLARINALTVCKGAEHGWPAGSLSVVDILVALHHRCQDAHRVVLSKGHAAAAQYAVLYGCGVMSADDLKDYKLGLGRPEAHADLVCDTGSLGQCLSTVAGMAAAARDKRFAVVLGDGELQEGQNYEALMTINHLGLSNVTVFVDVNGFQSDNRTLHIMPVHDLPSVLRGFGFDVVELADGSDAAAVAAAWASAAGRKVVVLCPTVKGHPGLMEPETHPVTGLEWQPWHTRIPSWAQYVAMVDALVAEAGCPATAKAWTRHRDHALTDDAAASLPNTQRPGVPGGQGTGKAFGERVCELLATNPWLAVVDADLATSCGFNRAVGHKRFFELGVAEQDAASFAAGLALRGMVPVLGTYSNFLKRCFENIFINLAEGARVIYAGNYSGLCYHTDGKSHQSINDASVFAGMPGLVVVDPVSPRHAAAVADWAVSDACGLSVYVRLRRTPAPEAVAAAFDAAAAGRHPVHDLVAVPPAEDGPGRGTAIVTMGTVAVELALQCQAGWARGATVTIVPSLSCDEEEQWRRALLGGGEGEDGRDAVADVETVITIEDDAGALRALVAQRVVALCASHAGGAARPPPVLVSKTVTGVGPSFRSKPACLEHFGFTADSVEAMWRDARAAR